MAASAKDRQAAWRQKQRKAQEELAQLRIKNDQLSEYIASLEADLQTVADCQQHHEEKRCESCAREGSTA